MEYIIGGLLVVIIYLSWDDIKKSKRLHLIQKCLYGNQNQTGGNNG